MLIFKSQLKFKQPLFVAFSKEMNAALLSVDGTAYITNSIVTEPTDTVIEMEEDDEDEQRGGCVSFNCKLVRMVLFSVLFLAFIETTSCLNGRGPKSLV